MVVLVCFLSLLDLLLFSLIVAVVHRLFGLGTEVTELIDILVLIFVNKHFIFSQFEDAPGHLSDIEVFNINLEVYVFHVLGDWLGGNPKEVRSFWGGVGKLDLILGDHRPIKFFFVFLSWSFFLLILYLLQTLIFQQKGSCSLIIRVGCQIILRIHKISKRRFGQFSLCQELISLNHERYEFLCIIIREYLSPAILGNGDIIFLKKKI